MLSFMRAVWSTQNTPPPKPRIADSASFAILTSLITEEFGDDISWEILTVSTPTNACSTSSAHSVDSNLSHSHCTSFDIDTFPKHSYMYPSDRNGTVSSETLSALMHPKITASSINETFQRHANSVNWPTLRNQLQHIASSASEHVNERLNRVFEGHDVPAMHDRIISIVPSMSLPDMRKFERTAAEFADAVQATTRQGCSVNVFLDQELQGDQWAFARIMGKKACNALVRQKICKEWQLTATTVTLHWHSHLHTSLATLFTTEKDMFGVTKLYNMTPFWTADAGRKTWCLELKTSLTDKSVEEDHDPHGEGSICLAVAVELPESWGCLAIENIEQRVRDDEDGWMTVDGEGIILRCRGKGCENVM